LDSLVSRLSDDPVDRPFHDEAVAPGLPSA
jgi:hypothetical protein